MSVIARRVLATPVRTSSATWSVITDILAPKAGEGRKELSAIAGVACSLIASEATSSDPIVVWGNGPRIRVYCIFGEDAITGDDENEEALATCPTTGNWSMSLACPEEDFAWVQQELARVSKRITARKLGEAVSEESSETSSASTAINEEAFFRP